MLPAVVQQLKLICLFLAVKWPKNQLMGMTSSFKTRFFEFIIDIRQNKLHFWNHETKLNKIGMFVKENFDFQNLTFLT